MVENNRIEFINITLDDLNRLEKWLSENNRGVTLDEITRRIIRGRIFYGPDDSPKALPSWVQEKKVLSWNEVDSWQVGSMVLVANNQMG